MAVLLVLGACASDEADGSVDELIAGGKEDSARTLVVHATGGSKDYVVTCNAKVTPCELAISWDVGRQEIIDLALLVLPGTFSWWLREGEAFSMELWTRNPDGSRGAALGHKLAPLDVTYLSPLDNDQVTIPTWVAKGMHLESQTTLAPGAQLLLRLRYGSSRVAGVERARDHWFDSEVNVGSSR